MRRVLTAVLAGWAWCAGGAAAGDFGRFNDTMRIKEIQDPPDPVITARYTQAFQRCQDAAQVTDENSRCFADEFSGGTIASLEFSACQTELTIRRTVWLERLR